MTPERENRFREVIARRQPNLTVILENVHDSHNIGAVLRSCDSVGVREIFVLYNYPELDYERLIIGKHSSAGARRWVDVNFYTDTEACFDHVGRQYDRVLGTRLHGNLPAEDLYEIDLTQSVALLFGNEHNGVSDAAQAHCDGNFYIPQVGMVRSLNISVACAVTLYEAFRQRRNRGFYDLNLQLPAEEREALFREYELRHLNKVKGKKVWRRDGGSW